MIAVYFAKNDKEWSKLRQARVSEKLPDWLHRRAKGYSRWKDKQACIIGKLMLAHVYNINPNDLRLEYTREHRPYLPGRPDFNISHSGTMVVCAVCTRGRVGIDVEKIKPVPIDDFERVFSNCEWQRIISNKRSPLRGFYSAWTKKEAALKAAGSGLLLPPQQIDVINEQVYINHNTWTLQKISICRSYICHIAMEIRQTVLSPLDLTPDLYR